MKENPFKRAIASHKQTTESVAEEIAPTNEELEPMQETSIAADQQANLLHQQLPENEEDPVKTIWWLLMYILR